MRCRWLELATARSYPMLGAINATHARVLMGSHGWNRDAVLTSTHLPYHFETMSIYWWEP